MYDPKSKDDLDDESEELSEDGDDNSTDHDDDNSASPMVKDARERSPLAAVGHPVGHKFKMSPAPSAQTKRAPLARLAAIVFTRRIARSGPVSQVKGGRRQ